TRPPQLLPLGISPQPIMRIKRIMRSTLCRMPLASPAQDEQTVLAAVEINCLLISTGITAPVYTYQMNPVYSSTTTFRLATFAGRLGGMVVGHSFLEQRIGFIGTYGNEGRLMYYLPAVICLSSFRTKTFKRGTIYLEGQLGKRCFWLGILFNVSY